MIMLLALNFEIVANWYEKQKIDFQNIEKRKGGQNISTRMGFEPTRAEHNGLAVHRLNHSATSSSLIILEILQFRFVN